MSASRRLLLLALLCACAGLYAGSASAARPPMGPLTIYPELLSTDHFEIHFTGELIVPPNKDRINRQQAGDLGAAAERAYATFVTTWGHPAPLNDGDGKVDIWVQDLQTATPGLLARVTPDVAANVSTSWIAIDPTVLNPQQTQHVAAHELLHVLQIGTWVPADGWLLEGSAEWGGFAVDDYRATDGTIGLPDMSLDCDGDSCGDDDYEAGGYSRWPFFQYLSERFGNTIVRDVFAKGAALADPAKTGGQLLDATLVDKGSTLPDAFNDYTLVNVAGGFGAAVLKGLAPTAYSTTLTGASTGALPVQRVSVDHLAARYLKLARGAGVGTQCYAATLSLTVAIPVGSASKPAFFSSALGSAGQRLAVNGSTASLTVPWDTCTGSAAGYLALPNASSTADSQWFTVSGSLTVDLKTPATPAAPPSPLYTGPTVAGPAADLAPSILVYGAELLRVPAATRVLRLIVFSSGAGQLRGALGGKAVGTAQLRAGNNDVRFKLSAAQIGSLRAAGSNASRTLALTSLSPQGATGTTVTRKVSVVAAPKPKKSASRR